MIHEIKRLVHETKELPFLIAEVENWRNEMNDILSDIFNQEEQKGLRDSAHEQFMKALNEAERFKNCLQSNISILNLCATFINKGMTDELMQIFTPAGQVRDLAESREQKPEGKQKNTPAEQETEEVPDLKTFKVLEAKKKPDGETRVWCQLPDGNKVAVFSEGEASEIFITSKGKEVTAWCRSKEKGFRAIRAEKLA